MPSSSLLFPRHMVCLNWLLAPGVLSLQDELTLGFLDYLLLGTPAAPLRKRLLESGLGEALVGGGVSVSKAEHCNQERDIAGD